MALTITVPDAGRTVIGNKRLVFGTIAFDTTYDNEAAGGESLTAGDLGLDKIDYISFTSDVVQCYWASDLLIAYYGDNDAAANGEFVEVTDSDDISAANVGFFAIGR
jgi:hypothetical protein